MGTEDIHNKFDEIKGGAKEKFGDVTDNEDLEAEGAAEKAKAKAKQAVEDAKDGIENATESAKDHVRSAFDR